jgi:parallel beta-helix repeat protein
MRRMMLIARVLALALIVSGLIGSTLIASVSRAQVEPAATGRTYYVRQTVGDDGHDGLSPATAWRHITKLTGAMRAGDTAYVGPGLYREQVTVYDDGTAENRLTFIADTTGQHTGDPPGVVMIAGSDPVDAGIFGPSSAPGVYTARFPAYPVLGVVEMDGAQYRYMLVRSKKEFPEGTQLPENYPFDALAKTPSTFNYDKDSQVLYIHTSDGKPPSTHEIELIRRSSGFLVFGRRYVTVIGFTFRHLGDSGIDFWRGASHGIAINNTAYGSRIGIRVLESPDVLLYGNTLFRNENSGAYFLRESFSAVAIGNTAYENVKGLRWGSRSLNGLALDNTLFDNHERGLAIEETGRVLLRRNRLVNNGQSQLLVLEGGYGSESNCFENSGPHQVTAAFSLVSFSPEHYKTLAEYQKAKRQDLDSREGGCGPLPQKIDVRKLHAETTAYAERARQILSGSPPARQ